MPGSRKRTFDGLTKDQRHRLKDLDAYRKRKRENAKTPEQRAKRVSANLAWREKNRARYNAWSRAYHARRRDHFEEYRLQKTYGISLAEKRAMLKEQRNLCAICNRKFKSTKQTHVDHCHRTGAVRGVICGTCNTTLGWYERYSDGIHAYLAPRLLRVLNGGDERC